MYEEDFDLNDDLPKQKATDKKKPTNSYGTRLSSQKNEEVEFFEEDEHDQRKEKVLFNS